MYTKDKLIKILKIKNVIFVVVPFDAEWNTGISIPVRNVKEESSIFPIQEYGWNTIEEKLREYVNCVTNQL